MDVYRQTVALRLIEMTPGKALAVMESAMLMQRFIEELKPLAEPCGLVHEDAVADPLDEGNQDIGKGERSDENNRPEEIRSHSCK